MRLLTVVQSTRPAFLVLTPVCVLLGLGSALATHTPVSVPVFVLALLGALSAHISVNSLNEYHDFRSGLDLHTNRTAFSGGSGALPGDPDSASAVLLVGLVSLVLTVLIGIYLVVQQGARILPIGFVGLVLVVTYTRWLNRYPVLCLVAPGLGFGVLMVLGTHVVLTGAYAALPLLIALVPFFLANNLLLLNQYPDIDADRRVGRRHFSIAYGIARGNLVYAAFALAAYGLIAFLALVDYIPRLGLIALVPMVFSGFALAGATRYRARIGEYPQVLAANVAAATLTPLLLGLAMLYG
jgi:1,4-dihydroxy-2-naphthoate octaprenyltransferase